MKKVYLIHGWGGNSSSEPWFSWLKNEFRKKNIELVIFDMPETDEPKIESWVGYMEKNIKDIDDKTSFIGHSIGCQTILRYLEKLPKHVKIGKCVFVAPWFDLINQEEEEMIIAHPWTTTKIDFSRVLIHCSKFLAIFSSDDPYVHLDQVEKFRKNLGAKVIIKKNQGHFNETKEIQEIIGFLQ